VRVTQIIARMRVAQIIVAETAVSGRLLRGVARSSDVAGRVGDWATIPNQVLCGWCVNQVLCGWCDLLKL
jgi:hypothetical protein